MNAIAPAPARTRGRPRTRPDEETRHLIALAARRSFLARGFAGTCMDDVAREAGVSKKTLYRLVPTKAELFRASLLDRIDAFLIATDRDSLARLPVRAALERVMAEYGKLTLSEETVAIQKIVIGESDRFPELAATFFTDAIMATHQFLADYLATQCRLGHLRLEDPHAAAGMLRGMMIMDPQRAAMMGQRPVPSTEAIAARARTCVSIFLGGCAGPSEHAAVS